MLLSVPLALWFAGRAGRFRLTQKRPRSRGRIRTDGVDRIRILVAGAGLAAGYGVERWEESLAGAMADRLAATTGRGVSVDFRTAPLLSAESAVDFLGINGAHTYQFVVFAPCFLEASVAPAASIARHAAAIHDHLLSTGGPNVRVLTVGLPTPERFSRMDAAARRAVSVSNDALRTSADKTDRVVFVDPPPMGSVHDLQPFTAFYYSQLGRDVADRLSELLPRADPDPQKPAAPTSMPDLPYSRSGN